MKNETLAPILVAVVALGGSFFLAKMLTASPQAMFVTLGMMAGALAIILTFINPIFGLYILTMSMMLSPEAHLGQAMSHRAILLRIDDILIILVAFTWFARSAIRKEVSTFRTTPLHKPVMLYMALIFLSTALGVMRDENILLPAIFFALKYFEYVMLFLLVVNMVDTREQLDRLVKLYFVTCAIVIVFAYGIVIFKKMVPYAPFDIEEGVVEPASLGGYLLISMGVGWGIFSRSPRSHWTWGLVSLWIASLPILFLTKSRASYFSLIVMMMLTLVFEKKRRWTLIFLLASSMFFIGEVFPNVIKTVKDRVMYTFMYQGGESRRIGGRSFYLEQSSEARIIFWKRAFTGYLPRHPLLGHGVGDRPALEGQIPVVAYETGIIGLIMFLWVLRRIFLESLSLFRDQPDPVLQGMAMGFLLGFSGVFVQSLVNTSFIIIRIMEPFWFFVGLISVGNRLAREKQGKWR